MTDVADAWLDRLVRWRAWLWLAAGIVLLIGLGTPQVTRTQEARVLETARQMLGQPIEKWLIPELNGDLRLQKPPLPYWYTAIAFSIGGVNEFIGRLPTAFLAWLTLAVTYLAGSKLFRPSIGVLAAAILLSSPLFARLGRLAETDLPATLFITSAIAVHIAILRSRAPQSLWLYHAAGSFIGLTAMSKGLPFLFPLLFIAISCLMEKRHDVLRRYILGAVPLTTLVIALPWFVYVASQRGAGTFIFEILNTTEGGGHHGSNFDYIPLLIAAAAPWVFFFFIAHYDMVRRWKTDPICRLMLLWIAVIAIPLLFNGAKQRHYLMPLLPIVAVVSAWWLVQVARWVKITVITALFLLLVIPPLVTVFAHHIDSDKNDEPQIAAQIRSHFGERPLAFYGPSRSIVLCFYLRRSVVDVLDPPAAMDWIAQHPDGVLIGISKDKSPEVTPPEPFHHVLEIDGQEHHYDFFSLSKLMTITAENPKPETRNPNE